MIQTFCVAYLSSSSLYTMCHLILTSFVLLHFLHYFLVENQPIASTFESRPAAERLRAEAGSDYCLDSFPDCFSFSELVIPLALTIKTSAMF